jgi:hypothetical protein
MGMKPRLEQPNKRIAPNLCSAPNSHPGEESNSNIDPKLVSKQKVEINHKLDPKLVSGPKQHEG